MPFLRTAPRLRVYSPASTCRHTVRAACSATPAPLTAHTKGVGAVDIDACDLGKGDGGARRCVVEEYRGVGDVSVVGCVGSLIVATRGVAGPGEVLLNVRGSKEAYLAWSDQPLPRGTEVLVIDIRGARTVLVEPWPLGFLGANSLINDANLQGDQHVRLPSARTDQAMLISGGRAGATPRSVW